MVHRSHVAMARAAVRVATVAMVLNIVVLDVFRIAMPKPSVDSSRTPQAKSALLTPAAASLDLYVFLTVYLRFYGNNTKLLQCGTTEEFCGSRSLPFYNFKWLLCY